MIKYPVIFPEPDPFRTDGLEPVMRFRSVFVLTPYHHAPLMRILQKLDGQARAGHLLDLAMEGAKIRYGLTTDTANTVGASKVASAPILAAPLSLSAQPERVTAESTESVSPAGKIEEPDNKPVDFRSKFARSAMASFLEITDLGDSSPNST